MFIIDEKDKTYRYGDHGPKYLIKGPHSNFGIIRLLPGEVGSPHFHKVMEENFYVLEGQVCISVDGVDHVFGKGQFLHLDPGEVHQVSNPTDEVLLMVVTAAPYAESDKYELVQP